jgi:prepilin-type N-terminal cleavage/methylation domain-containing protein
VKHYKVKSYARQAGMTLIELSVVLLILVGLAGLLIPYVGSFTQTTHDSTNSNNVTQLNNAFLRYTSEKNHLPPHVDLLTNAVAGTGTGSCSTAQTVGGIYCGLANSALFTPVTYAADSVAANSLANSGINMAVANDPTIPNKTFGTSTAMIYLNDPAGPVTVPMGGTAGYGGTTAFAAVAAVTNPALTVEQHLARSLGRDPMVYDSTCYDYIGVGLGDNNELIQSTMASAPVFFPQDAQAGPTEAYGHFIAILQVDKANTGNGVMGMPCSGVTEKAKFLGVVANVPSAESPTLVGSNTLLAQTYTNRAAN